MTTKRKQRFKIIVCGYLREQVLAQEIPSEIERLIFMFYFFKMDSKLLEDKQIDTLIKLLPNSETMNELKLIFRATDDGFDCKSFHKKCDKKSPLFSIVKTRDNWIIGGYSKCEWDISLEMEGSVKDDKLESFIFVLESPDDKYKKDLPHKWFVESPSQNPDAYALYNYDDGFGYGNDWWVEWKDGSIGSFIAFGTSYDVKPENMRMRRTIKISVDDYEIWQAIE